MHLILTGATGLVGSGALHAMLKSPQVTKISILSRRTPVPQAEGHEKVEVIVHKDFAQYPPDLLEKLQGAEGCVWALGVSQTQVSDKDKYTEITMSYPLAAAKAFSSLSDPFKFVYVSGEGATTSPGHFTPLFGRVKGQTEAALLDLHRTSHPSLKPYSLRPGGVDASAHPDIQPFIPKVQAWALRASNAVVLPVARALAPGVVSPTQELGEVLLRLAAGDGEPVAAGKGVLADGTTITNAGFRRLAGI